MTVLRDAAPGDVPAMLGFARALAEHEGRPEGTVVATEAMLREAFFGAAPIAWALVAERDGAAVGYAAWSYPFRVYQGRSVMHVSNVFVVPETRGAGTGRAIFAELARRCLDRGCAALEWGVKDDNVTALAFYDALGAQRRTGGLSLHLEGEALRRLAA
ncbi:GNAT family N-acetyltransferase [Roseomonas sp. OT10]|uniref:GNAT family N-acetyltransferase n=1 Tax=Roseomonas cutis TaxID=2897332 RepID=UPI001E4876F7|nr:GNAT family N-acetyltransferase [Roseomonas sp. OT10]UFN50798.1 GNAT family N-acetyltransferase [Roseomonas sp. OT10]